ncbi:hypothetical protein EJ05DRAFT_485224 [Pseudovirgaria hyperparasitica]|uniref:P-loop containing nucleoside triphosphate hydrolase protein n=1 Tax=Pseudovirgaria hyperparasitica TaxID=470096 RepID=A0A6A6W8I4_9PEZI|nr:uncharacterized protein EJ05DRAFT_485224 [Pseudovirgaria hyperparasitica]KAF2759162.1 hypothetical protein EJ05DRAFT_485224 [Pseudovirgaria hyperparasitica]
MALHGKKARYHASSESPQHPHELNATLPERFRHPNESSSDVHTQYPRARGGRHLTTVHDYFKAAAAPCDSSDRWYHRPEIPSSGEICPFLGSEIIDNNELPKNLIKGPWPSKDAYLEAQYRLVREDSTRALCDAVEALHRNPNGLEADFADSRFGIGTGIGIYEKVTPVAFTTAPARGVAVRVVFSLRRVGKKIRWEQSKRLISGTLVALSPAADCFRSRCVMAVVAARPLDLLGEYPPAVDLFFPNDEEMCLDSNEDMIMVENRAAYFESDRHTMVSLQKLMKEPFPLSEHIVDVQQEVEPPQYFCDNPRLNLGAFVSDSFADRDRFQHIDVLKSWPNEIVFSGMDASQQSALHRILTKRVAIIQGPPGTGKTYVSVMALRIMMGHSRAGDPPIVVACQTNHALDQILSKVADFAPDSFIRLGGRSKGGDVIKRRTLFEVRKQNGGGAGVPLWLRKDMRNIEIKMQEALSVLKPPEGPDEAAEPFPLDKLRELDIISQDQYQSLLEDDPKYNHTKDTGEGSRLLVWAGSQLRQITPATDRIDEAVLPFEEVDLEEEEVEEREAEFQAKDDERDIEALKGHTQYITNNWAADSFEDFTDEQVEALLAKHKNLWSIKKRFRGTVFEYFQRRGKERVLAGFRSLATEYRKMVQSRKAYSWQSDAELLKAVKIIGVTTTGLSKYRPMLTASHPQIVLIEEAAETLEAPVTAGCFESVQHLILVGDHKQLRPHCNLKKLEKDDYNFNISLFERLVENKVDFTTLRMQRRMIPEIRQILDPIYGKNFIIDDPGLSDSEIRPPVPGMGDCSLYFYTHEYEESRDDLSSCQNVFEADMIYAFCRYLIMNGTPVERITCLTFYNAQRKLLQAKLKEYLGRDSTNVVTVDSYQGEENDIIILSLVRNNGRGSIGFLEVENRVCVALSRARRGLYIFGNGELLAGESRLWSQVIDILFRRKYTSGATKTRRRIGYHVTLQCVKHDNKTFIEEYNDWEGVDGGCRCKCREKRSCGHPCQLHCHAFPCDDIVCVIECSTLLPCGHTLIQPCGAILVCQDCPPAGTEFNSPPKKRLPRTEKIAKASESTLASSETSDPLKWQGYARRQAKQEDAELERNATEFRRQNHVSLADIEIRNQHGSLVERSSLSKDQEATFNISSTPLRSKEVHTWKHKATSQDTSYRLGDNPFPFAGPSAASSIPTTKLPRSVHDLSETSRRAAYSSTSRNAGYPRAMTALSPQGRSRPEIVHTRDDPWDRPTEIDYNDNFPAMGTRGTEFNIQIAPGQQQPSRCATAEVSAPVAAGTPRVFNSQTDSKNKKNKGKPKRVPHVLSSLHSNPTHDAGTHSAQSQLLYAFPDRDTRAPPVDEPLLNPCDDDEPIPTQAEPWSCTDGPKMGKLIDID